MLRPLDPMQPHLDCPFCEGATVVLEVDEARLDSFAVICRDCDIHGPVASSEALALERWNAHQGSSAKVLTLLLERVELLATNNRLRLERDEAVSARNASAEIAHSLSQAQAA